VPHFPRFRALALFGRRPQERVDSVVIPASKNLHNSGIPAWSKSKPVKVLHSESLVSHDRLPGTGSDALTVLAFPPCAARF
jgi:hypothetical protein